MILILSALLLGLLGAHAFARYLLNKHGEPRRSVYVLVPIAFLLAVILLNQGIGLSYGYLQPEFTATTTYQLRAYKEGVGQKGKITYLIHSFQYYSEDKWILRTVFSDEVEVVYADVQAPEYQKGYTLLVLSDSAPIWARYVFFPLPDPGGPYEYIVLPDGKG